MKGGPFRILLKLSGEAFGETGGGFSQERLARIASEISGLSQTEIAIVVGGGNIIRGGKSGWLDRVEADTLGMLATIINAIALRSYLEREGRKVIVQSAIDTEFTSRISPREARSALHDGAIVLFAGGTGSPFVTTDTAAALRAASIDADLLAKGSDIAGVYTADPDLDPEAELLSEITYDDYLEHRYLAMDQVAVEICRENSIPIEVFDFRVPGALARLAAGERVGTRIAG